MSRLEEELDQEKKKYTMLEIKLRNSERAREDAEKRNQLLQREMDQQSSSLLRARPPGLPQPREEPEPLQLDLGLSGASRSGTGWREQP